MKKWLSKVIEVLTRKNNKLISEKEEFKISKNIKENNLRKQRQIQLIANRTKTARIRVKNIKRLVSLIEQGDK